MKKILAQVIMMQFFCCSIASAYIYHCPSTIPDRHHSGDQEMWPETIIGDQSVIGTYHFTGAEYNYITGEGSCMYKCNGCNSQGYCECNKPGGMLINGVYLEPIISDSSKWKPSLNGNTATCSVFSNDACPWKLKGSGH